MEFSLLTLGTASALPTANRYPSAHILTVRERLFLIDCGEGTQMQLRRAGISFSKIDHIFISHLHGDHTYGLFGLLSTISMSNRTTPLYIYAPEGFKAFLDFFMSQFGEGVKYPIVHVVVKCSQPTEILRTKQVTVEAFPLVHRTETYGFLFKEAEPQVNVHKHLIEPKNDDTIINNIKNLYQYYDYSEIDENNELVDDLDYLFVDEDGNIVEYKETLLCKDFTYKPYVPRSFAYCTDTMYFKRLSKWIENVDLMYHDSTYTTEFESLAKANFHSTSAQAAMCAKEANAKKLLLGHFSSRYKSLDEMLNEAREVFSNTFLAKEGIKFEIPFEKINIR